MSTTKTLTTPQLMQAFGVSHVTLLNWRKGTPTKAPLPTVEGVQGVQFSPSAVKDWAKTHGLKMSPMPKSSTEFPAKSILSTLATKKPKPS